MKKTLILFLITLNVFSQKTSDFKEVIINGCKLSKYEDKFEKTTTYRTNFIQITKGNLNGVNNLEVMFLKTFTNTKTEMTAIFTGGNNGCIDERSFVDILLSDGNKIRLESISKKIICGTHSIIVSITEEEAEKLLNSEMTNFRLSFIDSSNDFEAIEKLNKKFKEQLLCISNITQ